MLLKNVPVRRGYAFLEPANVTIIPNSRVDELEQARDAAFVRGLRLRLGLPDADPDATPVAPPNQNPPPPPPPQQAAQPLPAAPIEIDSPPHAPPRPLPQATRNDGVVRSNYFANPPPHSNTTQTLPKVEPVHLNAAFNTNPPRSVPAPQADESFDFDEFDNLGDDVLEAVEAMELQAMQNSSNAVVAATSSRATQSSTRAGTSTFAASTAVASGSRASGGRTVVKEEVIMLDDDEDDKENVFWKSPPVTQRRRNARPPADEEVIEISD